MDWPRIGRMAAWFGAGFCFILLLALMFCPCAQAWEITTEPGTGVLVKPSEEDTQGVRILIHQDYKGGSTWKTDWSPFAISSYKLNRTIQNAAGVWSSGYTVQPITGGAQRIWQIDLDPAYRCQLLEIRDAVNTNLVLQSAAILVEPQPVREVAPVIPPSAVVVSSMPTVAIESTVTAVDPDAAQYRPIYLGGLLLGLFSVGILAARGLT